MTKCRKKTELSRLIEEWDNILKATGFKDIERTIEGERVLVQFASNVYRQADPLTRESKMSYYEQMASRAQEFQFLSEMDRIVMMMIVEGSKIKAIVEELNHRGYKVHRQTIRFIRRRYENEWGVKVWSLKQMNLKTNTK
jgi:hypothetical protein